MGMLHSDHLHTTPSLEPILDGLDTSDVCRDPFPVTILTA